MSFLGARAFRLTDVLSGLMRGPVSVRSGWKDTAQPRGLRSSLACRVRESEQLSELSSRPPEAEKGTTKIQREQMRGILSAEVTAPLREHAALYREAAFSTTAASSSHDTNSSWRDKDGVIGSPKFAPDSSRSGLLTI